MARKTLTFAFFALIAITAHAQHFDWAKGYGSSQEGCLIKGTVTDGDGNLYILGQFTKDATWDGQRILPIAPYGPGQNSINTLIAKISPSGEMLWKKVIHSNNGQNNLPIDIKLLGDTAVACLVQVRLPSTDAYCYYLDTLIPSTSDYPISTEQLSSRICTSLIILDFDGNILEDHFLYTSYVDIDGNDIVYDNPDPNVTTPILRNLWLRDPSFDIDNDGNVFVCRIAQDKLDDLYDVQRGTISGIKFWVDGRHIGTSSVENHVMGWFPQIIKYSPHFDTLLTIRNVVQSCDSVEYQSFTSLKVDRDNHVFLIGKLIMSGYHTNNIVIDSSQDIILHHPDRTVIKGYLLHFDSDLNAKYLISLDDSVINPTIPAMVPFHDIVFDYDSNRFFLSATCNRGMNGDTVNFYSVPMYRGIPLNVKNDAIIMAFSLSENTPELLSYGSVPSIRSSDCNTNSIGNLACGNNRVFLQTKYRGGVRFPENTIQFNNWNDQSLGLLIFNYSLKPIYGVHYFTSSPNSKPQSISFSDSTLYLSSLLSNDNATFGNIHVFEQGIFSCITKYTDTSFMTPYVPTTDPIDTGEVSITLVEDGAALVAYPNPFRQSVRIKVQGRQLKEHNGTVTAILTDLTGRREEVRLTPSGERRAESGECVYTLDLSSRPQATYLLTLTTADGKQHTVRLLKQSDMFGN